MTKKIQKKFLFFKIIPSDFVAFYCVYQAKIVAISTECNRKQF